MRKRYLSLFLSVLVAFSMIQAPVFASAEGPEDPRSSSYLNMYYATLLTDGTVGTLTLSYEVQATGTMTSVGVLGIFVRNSAGSICGVIWGSNANGLLASNTWIHAGDYDLNLTSGNTYYCSVVFIAEDANGNDTRTINTKRVTCP